MKRFAHIVLLLVGMQWLWPGGLGFAAQPRVALVIGNSAYTTAPSLPNPANDARLMAETLRTLGFDVIERIDADRDTILLATFELQDRLIAAGKDAIGLFFYAGHGVQVGGENYFIPLKTEIMQEREVSVKAISASFVLKQMEFAENSTNFVILDACRNNPFPGSTRAVTRGLARMEAPTGSLVAYSTGPGEVAADGDGHNSPYVLALTEAMQIPGLPAELMFKRVRERVLEVTRDKQTPWEESSLKGGDFYFSIDVTVAVAAPDAPTASDSAATTQQETVFWETIRESNDPAMFEEYIRQYPDGTFSGLAKIKRDSLIAPPVAKIETVPNEAPQEEQVALATERSADQELVSENPWMTVSQISSLLIGNGAALKGVDDDGVGWREVYEPGGVIRGIWRNIAYTGRWSFQGDLMCFDYEDEEIDVCSYLSIDGINARWWYPDGSPDDTASTTIYIAP